MKTSNKKISVIIALSFLSACSLFAEMISQEYILSKYKHKVDSLIKIIMNDDKFYDRLGYLCDIYGHRLSGSENLEKALDWLQIEMQRDGLQNVARDSVWVPHWVRGEEKCQMLLPWRKNIPVIAFGGSISTPKEGIEADVLVVKSFDELKEKSSLAIGKIVVFNVPFVNYGQAVQFRFRGAIEAAASGAVASLTRSVTPQSNSLHTGMMIYDDKYPKIPHGAITIEDADLLERIQSRGLTPRIRLILLNETKPDALSWNLRSELVGKDLPNEIIAFGGHIDSWDVGTGAHDDACGCIASWAALKYIKDANLHPRRTLRVVFWANEENGVRGGKAYCDQHSHEQHSLMFEFDAGCFRPSKIGFSGPDTLLSIIKFFEPLLQKIDSITVVKGGGGVDIDPMVRTGVPAMSLWTDSEGKYFRYHHSELDTFDKINKQDFQKCIAAIAVVLYLYADLPLDYIQFIKQTTH